MSAFLQQQNKRNKIGKHQKSKQNKLRPPSPTPSKENHGEPLQSPNQRVLFQSDLRNRNSDERGPIHPDQQQPNPADRTQYYYKTDQCGIYVTLSSQFNRFPANPKIPFTWASKSASRNLPCPSAFWISHPKEQGTNALENLQPCSKRLAATASADKGA